jgi:hypothetical protein
MHLVVDTSPTGWLLGLAFYKSNLLREVEGFYLSFEIQTLLLAMIRGIKICWVLWCESETPVLGRTGINV